MTAHPETLRKREAVEARRAELLRGLTIPIQSGALRVRHDERRNPPRFWLPKITEAALLRGYRNAKP